MWIKILHGIRGRKKMDKFYRDFTLEINNIHGKKEKIKLLIDTIENNFININDEKKSLIKKLREKINKEFLLNTVKSVFNKREKNIFTLEQIIDETYFPGE
jgi:hypothetical protein